MSKKIDQFYIDAHGNFRGLVYEISAITAPKENVVYDPYTAQLIIAGTTYNVGNAYFEDDDVLQKLEKKP